MTLMGLVTTAPTDIADVAGMACIARSAVVQAALGAAAEEAKVKDPPKLRIKANKGHGAYVSKAGVYSFNVPRLCDLVDLLADRDEVLKAFADALDGHAMGSDTVSTDRGNGSRTLVDTHTLVAPKTDCDGLILGPGKRGENVLVRIRELLAS
jgi:hypothetical protein